MPISRRWRSDFTRSNESMASSREQAAEPLGSRSVATLKHRSYGARDAIDGLGGQVDRLRVAVDPRLERDQGPRIHRRVGRLLGPTDERLTAVDGATHALEQRAELR